MEHVETTQMKAGIMLPLRDLMQPRERRTWEQTLVTARHAEAAGLDSAWIADHLFIQGPDGTRGGSLEALSTLAGLATATQRLELGTLVLCDPFRHPAILAKMAGTLQEMSGGRFVLGLGCGWHQPEFDAYGIGFDDKVQRFEESARAVTAMLRGESYTHAGKIYTFDDAVLLPKPEHPTRLLIAAKGPRMLRLTAELAQSFNTAWMGADTALFSSRLADLRAACDKVGRDLKSIEVTVGLLTLPVEKEADIDTEFARLQGGSPALAATDSKKIRRDAICGTPAMLAEQFRAYFDAGADHLILVPSPEVGRHIDEDRIDLIGEAIRILRG